MAKVHQVIVDELKLYGHHGTQEEERLQGTYFQYDLRVSTDFTKAMYEDALDGTINYVELIEIIKKVNSEPVKLLENLGGKICKEVFDSYPTAKAIRLKIQKLKPPIREDLKSVAILIEESR